MNGLDMRIRRFVIDKSTAFQTICQIIKYYQTRIWGYMPNHVYGYMGYRGYRGYKGLSIYRPNNAISHTETLNVSHSGIGGMGGYRARVYKEIPNHIYWTYNTYAGYKGLNGLRLNGLIKNKLNMVFFILNVSPRKSINQTTDIEIVKRRNI